MKAKADLLFLTCLFLLVSCGSGFSVITPLEDSTTDNNMPLVVWTEEDCDHYEIWIDGIRTDSLGSALTSAVPFPLSFGPHSLKVAAVKDGERRFSPERHFMVDDGTLNTLPEGSRLLRHDWAVASSVEVGLDGASMSSPSMDTGSWSHTSVPATVLTALVRNGIYPNPYFGKNNMLIPDMNDEHNEKYDLLKYSHLKGINPWKNPYWFRTEFSLEEGELPGSEVWLNFAEINYRAEVWLNGIRLAGAEDMVGMERAFRFEVGGLLDRDGRNVLAVLIYPVDDGGKPEIEPLEALAPPGENMGDGRIATSYTKWDALGWDWQPPVRDREMGITEEVWLSSSDGIEIADLYISAEPCLPDTLKAEVAVSAEIVNRKGVDIEAVVRLEISFGGKGVVMESDISLPAGTSVRLMMDKSGFPELLLEDAKLWWPYGYGGQNLYEAELSVVSGGVALSSVSDTFGIRKLETYIGKDERVYKVNGREIYLRGGNWVLDMMLNWNASRYEKEILLTRNSNMNILRVWGPTGVAPEVFYDAADKYGILIWQDFLNDYWGTFRNTPGYQPELELYRTVTTEIVKKYRNHPSLIIWCGGNEGLNPREEMIVGEILPENDGRTSRHYLRTSNGDGLHGSGPYCTIAPRDYFTDPKLHGFSSEIGPSGVPVAESLYKALPDVGESWLEGRFPLDGQWAYHDANNWPAQDTRKFTRYDDLLRSYYGDVVPGDDIHHAVGAYMAKAQLLNYEVYRASIESVTRKLWDKASGILLWKSNSSWPSMVWQIYDWYLQAHAGYYAAKKACGNIHVQFNRNDGSVSVVSLGKGSGKTVVTAEVRTSLMELAYVQCDTVNLVDNGVALSRIRIDETPQLQLLSLRLHGADGGLLAENHYWINENDDYTHLNALPKASLKVSAHEADAADGRMARYEVKVENVGESAAVLTELKVVGRETRMEMLPCLWSDNYFTLLPGESRDLTVELFRSDINDEPVLEYSVYGGNTLYVNL